MTTASAVTWNFTDCCVGTGPDPLQPVRLAAGGQVRLVSRDLAERALPRCRSGRVPDGAPMSWLWTVLHRVAVAFVVTGALIIGFVPYQLWGTGLETARAQDQLAAQFELDVSAGPAWSHTGAVPPGSTRPANRDGEIGAPSTLTPTTGAPVTQTRPATGTATETSTAPVTVAVRSVEASVGDGVARLQIPKIGVDQIVVLGVSRAQLRAGPGMHPSSAAPGSVSGNTVIAGHRTTYGAPFWSLNELDPGDGITVTTSYGTFTYTVTATSVVSPDDPTITGTTTEPLLTLYTCEPRYSARKRLVVTAAPATPTTGTAIGYTTAQRTQDTTGTMGQELDSALVPDGPDEVSYGAADEQLGWNTDRAAWRHVTTTTTLFVIVTLIASWAVRSSRRRWKPVTVTVSVPVVLVCVWWLYGAVNAVVPAGV
jgi:LPXTG-site transpeptidase (sortase) family protein